MSLDDKIELILNNPQSDWHTSFLNQNVIIEEYFKLKIHLKKEFKEKSITWLSQAIENNQENLIMFLSKFTPIDNKILAKSFGYNRQNIFEHLEYVNACQNDPSPYKINLNLTVNNEFNYFKVYYGIINNKEKETIELIDSNFINRQPIGQLIELLNNSINNVPIFNHLITQIQKSQSSLDNTSEYETETFEKIVLKIIENDSLTHNHAEFFSEIHSRLTNQEVKDKLFNYLFENAKVDDKSIIDYDFYLFNNDDKKLEKIFDYFKFTDKDYYELLELRTSDLTMEKILSIYYKIKEHTVEGEKKLIYSVVTEDKEEFLDFILIKNEYDFKDYNNEILKFLAKTEDSHFDKMLDVLLTKAEAEYLGSTLSSSNENVKTKSKMKI